MPPIPNPPNPPNPLMALSLELQAERLMARRCTLALRFVSFGSAGAFLVCAIILKMMDPFYLILSGLTCVSSASQFVVVERFRVPTLLERLASGAAEPSVATAALALWPDIRATHGREIAALGPTLMNTDEVGRMTLDEAVSIVRTATPNRWPWRRIGTPYAIAFALVVVGTTVAVLTHTHSPD